MAESLPAHPAPSILTPLTDPAGGAAMARLQAFAGQGAVRRMLPAFAGMAALGGAALVWSLLSPSPQRPLYTHLGDSERATVAEALDKASITYAIDNSTGALTVSEGDYYRARMLVASDGALATPDGGKPLDALPMGASRALEGEHLRAAREHELTLTISEIDGVEAVRVHLAEGEKSVFVRENSPPSASVMVRLAKGRQLSDGQVAAVVNLVAASVPGLTPDAVRVADQHGRLLTAKTGSDSDRLELQARMEEKLRNQLDQLLGPMLGTGKFTSEIQVELDMDQVTSAKEAYDKSGVVRSETQQQSSSAGSAPGQAIGVPGVLSNTPPPSATAVAAPPQGTAPAPAAAAASAPVNGEASTTRNYELGREVSVANSAPGRLKRLSVAVAIDEKALKDKAGIEQVKQLVSAAVGADLQRGDQVAVVARKFSTEEAEGLPFYETGWFGMVVRNGIALLGLLLVLLLGVKPLIKALKREPSEGGQAGLGETEETGNGTSLAAPKAARPIDPERLSQQVGLAQRVVAEQPDNALIALRQMINQADSGAQE